MEHSSRRLFGGNPATAPDGSRPPRRDDSGVSPSVHSDLALARVRNANLLVVGRERQVLNLVSMLVPDLNPGLVIRYEDGRLVVPPPSSRIGTVVVRDVDALPPEEQRKLLEWLDSERNERTQVVSTASAPLLPLVEARAFNDALYYRLNTVYIDLSE